jgi:tetratricopeptide (TPR) repeat protein
LAQQLSEGGQYIQAGEVLERLIAEEPFDEATVRQLMRVHVQLGRRGLAISVYENYRILCIEQLHVEPETETQILFETILARTALPRVPIVAHGHAETKPGTLIPRAVKALQEGNRFELLNMLKRLSAIKDPRIAFQRDLLYVDECLQRGEISRAWQLLDTIQKENELVELRRAILYIEQHNFTEAEQILTRVLKISVDEQNRELESEALENISKIKLQRAEFQDALRVISRSIHIATQIDKPFLVAKGYLQKAKIHYKQGTNQDARDILSHAESLAHTHNFSCLLVEINALLASSFQRSGLYLSAYKVYNKALGLARDTGMRKDEAQILLGFAASCDFLGRKTECIQALETAKHIYGEMNDREGLATVDYNLAAALPYHDESKCEDAIRFARSALTVFIETDQKGLQAVAHTSLAFAMWIKGRYQDAIKNFKKSIDLHKELGEYNYIPELCAYIGLAHLGMGNINDALEWTDKALHEQAMLNLSDIVTDIYYARGAALDASGKPREAIRYYKQAYQTLLDYAKDIEEEDARLAYFHRDPITRRLMTKVYELNLAPKAEQISFKHKIAGAASKRTEVTLTIYAGPADQALAKNKGSAAVRRTRLERMLQQAERQNAKLSLEELAHALKVSTRTIQRDLTAIHSQQNTSSE